MTEMAPWKTWWEEWMLFLQKEVSSMTPKLRDGAAETPQAEVWQLGMASTSIQAPWKRPVMVWKRHCRAPFQKAVRQHSESIRPLLAMCVTARPRWEKSADHLALSHQKRCRIDVKPIKMFVVIQRNVDQCTDYLVSSKIIPTKTGWWPQYVSTLCGGDPYVEWGFPIGYTHEVVCLDGHKLMMYGAYIFIQLPNHHIIVPLMTLPELGIN